MSRRLPSTVNLLLLVSQRKCAPTLRTNGNLGNFWKKPGIEPIPAWPAVKARQCVESCHNDLEASQTWQAGTSKRRRGGKQTKQNTSKDETLTFSIGREVGPSSLHRHADHSYDFCTLKVILVESWLFSLVKEVK